MVSEALRTSFTTSYLALMGYTGITLIEALRTPNLNSRHIMNIETTVSIVAGLVYGMFLEKIKKPDVDFSEITKLRYLDWAITTPLIILTMVLFYSGNSTPPYHNYLILVLLNCGMLLAGYLGETKQIDKMKGFFLGFIFFALMLYSMISCCIPAGANLSVFIFFAIVWTGYGFAYLLKEEEKNLSYNILDVISKALFGIVLYFYYGKVLKF
jgi:bacteriorhodopsin